MLTLRPSDIEIGERHRALSNDAVERLAASMSELGLRQPITVRVVDMMVLDGQEVEGVPVLVAGRHRLAAASKLGWDTIDCIEIEGDEITAEIWEISENLHRLDLTKDQRDEHIRRYAELLEARQEVSQQNASKPKSGPQGGRPVGVPRQIAEETGLSVDTVRRALRPPQVKEVQPAKSREETILTEANAIISAWNRASPEAREMALAEIDEPVFDKTRSAA